MLPKHIKMEELIQSIHDSHSDHTKYNLSSEKHTRLAKLVFELVEGLDYYIHEIESYNEEKIDNLTRNLAYEYSFRLAVQNTINVNVLGDFFKRNICMCLFACVSVAIKLEETESFRFGSVVERLQTILETRALSTNEIFIMSKLQYRCNPLTYVYYVRLFGTCLCVNLDDLMNVNVCTRDCDLCIFRYKNPLASLYMYHLDLVLEYRPYELALAVVYRSNLQNRSLIELVNLINRKYFLKYRTFILNYSRIYKLASKLIGINPVKSV